ncbi:copper ion binding protein [Paenibacillus sp. LMG 31456]|uniref:Copper ion binding protein n=1 Tax=Paenibacillus foliorum TaxID=2654974 RepID=A0A972GJY1_9BACL|nr:copper ion binding protein [Paenibacillus foliorum]NOU92097.1 copper ion binding protein [Paenibacillus foliorum]
MTNVTLQVEGMSCGHCVNSIEGALQKIGVEGKVDLGSKAVTVSFDEQKVSLNKVKETIEDQGYDVL